MKSEKGLDLPTKFLDRPVNGFGAGRNRGSDVADTGRADLTTRCTGYVRNVVPHPDDTYPHPVPHAHLPVIVVDAQVEPVVAGTWVTLDAARQSLDARHWWPIVEQSLRPAR